MLYLYTGTDRERVRKNMNAAIAKVAGVEVTRITDAHTVEDLRAALRGPGMFTPLEAGGSLTGFGGTRVLVFEGVCANPELSDVLLDSLTSLSESEESVFVFEEKPLADVRKKLEKYAETVEKFDAPKKERDSSIFAIANALRKADKKTLWVSYMREIAKDAAPEAIHGVLFWAAKDMFLNGDATARVRATALIAQLADLPHAARRRGFELEYALERFVLSLS